MATLRYSQTGITNDVLEDLRRRRRERGERAPYRPSLDGMSEQDTEEAINRAQVSDRDAGDAAQDVRERAQLRLRAPMSDTEPMRAAPLAPLRPPMSGTPAVRDYAPPAPAPVTQPAGPKGPSSADLDASDRALAERAQRRQRVIAALGAIGTLFGDRSQDASRMALMQAAQSAQDPAQFQARIDARAAQRTGQSAAKDEAAIADEERALNTDYRRSLMRSMGVNADRREFEMSRRTDADARLYDPAHPVAEQRREFLRRIMATAPEIARGLEGQDLDALGSAELRQITDQTLRRIGQTPARYRQADLAELMRIAAELDAADAPEAPPAPVAEPPAPPMRTSGGARRAPVATEQAAVVPAVRRDRSLDQMYADILAERAGQPTSTGEPARSFTAPERVAIARAARNSRTKQAANFIAGIDTQSREAQNIQTQTGDFATQQDLVRVERAARPIQRLVREATAAIDEYERLAGGSNRPITQAQFEAMVRGGPAARFFGTDNLSALARTFTNIQLHEQTGSAQTTGETERFFAALNMNSMADPAQFYASMRRMRRAALADLDSIRSSNPAAFARLRGRP